MPVLQSSPSMPSLHPFTSASRRFTQPPPYEGNSIDDESTPGSLTLLSTQHHHHHVSGSIPIFPQSTHEQYPLPDPFVGALNHVEKLQQLCLRSKESDRQRILHLGELVTALTQLLRKARLLNALDIEEEQEQLEDLTSNISKIDSFLDSASASAQRRTVWKRAHVLIMDIEKRLAEEHVASSLTFARQAIEEAQEERRQRERQAITQ